MCAVYLVSDGERGGVANLDPMWDAANLSTQLQYVC